METLNFLQKVATLLQSRRFWLLIAQAVVYLILIVNVIMPVLDQEPVEEPDAEAVADRLALGAEKIAALIMAGLGALAWLRGAQQTNADYTIRPAGVADKVGIAR